VWMKYPNPFSSHVLAADVLNRFVDAQTGCLHTTRLILKTGTMPNWLLGVAKSQDAFVIEESVVDPERSFMETRTRNLSHQRFLVVEEVQTYTRNPEDSGWTLADTRAIIRSNFGARWAGLAARIEGVGIRKFKDHLQRSKMAMAYILDKLRSREKCT
jgi:4-amino-4-deoxychorismate lyase